MKTNSLATKTKEKMNAVSTAVNGAVISAILGISNMVFASGGPAGSVSITATSMSMGSLFSSIFSQFLNIFFYIGVLVLLVGGGMLGLAIKNDDADGKTKAFLTMAAGIVLITLKSIMDAIGVI